MPPSGKHAADTPRANTAPDATVHRLLIAYDGTHYLGWQRQGENPTIQLTVEKAIEKCWGTFITLHGSGRTDQGVHALGQVAHFIAPRKFKSDEMLRALNANLPKDIRVLSSSFSRRDFHARFSAVGKEYHYRIEHAPFHSPFEIGRSWHRPRPMDLEAIREALSAIVGEHDFASFTSNPGYERKTTVRQIYLATLSRSKTILTVKIRGNGFLYRMVRNLVGAITLVGHGDITVDEFKKILLSRKRSAAPNTAPAGGLYLARVFYNERSLTRGQ